MAQFVEEFTSSSGLGFDMSLRLQLVIEELATNMMKYSVGEGSEFDISLERDHDTVLLNLVEPDVEEYDPVRNAPDLDTTDESDRRAGGMGLFMVRQLADVSYRYTDRTGVTTLKLKIGEPDV
jgi:anti-sigma regulatory factor (Ser/Thr protein kinase)